MSVATTTGEPESRITPGRWFSIGIVAGPNPLELGPIPTALEPALTYRDVTDQPAIFVADPFLLRHDERWHMFFEVLDQDTYKGEIAHAVSDDAVEWRYRGRVLVEPFNVSYPHVFSWQGEIYMVPEMHGQNAVCLYRAREFPDHWERIATLVEDGPVADPTLFRHGDDWWLLACAPPFGHRVLRLYRSHSLFGPWHEHPASPIVPGDEPSDSRRARPAGRVVSWQGRLLRFAQDCHPRYGTGVRAFEITRLTPKDYVERAIEDSPIQPPAAGSWNSRAMHHIDAHPLADGSWLAAIDGHDHPSYADSESASS